jgi:hypothetical protein
MFEVPITEKTFLIIAMHHYDKTQCESIDEFNDDLKRFSYLKKLFGRYLDNNELKERLILNHIIVLYNMFGLITTDLLFYKMDKKYWNILATFLIFLDKMPEYIPDFQININNMKLDYNILSILRSL